MDSLELVLHRAFGAAFCIYGVKSLADGFHLQAWEARSFKAVAPALAGLLLVLSGLGAVLAPRDASSSYLAVPAIGLLGLVAVLERRASETIDLALLAGACLYLVTA